MRHGLLIKLAYLILALLPVQTFAASGGFTGSESWANFRAEHYKAWKSSHHDLAMQHANSTRRRNRP